MTKEEFIEKWTVLYQDETVFEEIKKFMENDLKELFDVNSDGPILCQLKDTSEDEKVLIRESINGLKYLIFDNDSISFARTGNEIGVYETIHFDGSNGKMILESWVNDQII